MSVLWDKKVDKKSDEPVKHSVSIPPEIFLGDKNFSASSCISPFVVHHTFWTRQSANAGNLQKHPNVPDVQKGLLANFLILWNKNFSAVFCDTLL